MQLQGMVCDRVQIRHGQRLIAWYPAGFGDLVAEFESALLTGGLKNCHCILLALSLGPVFAQFDRAFDVQPQFLLDFPGDRLSGILCEVCIRRRTDSRCPCFRMCASQRGRLDRSREGRLL